MKRVHGSVARQMADDGAGSADDGAWSANGNYQGYLPRTRFQVQVRFQHGESFVWSSMFYDREVDARHLLEELQSFSSALGVGQFMNRVLQARVVCLGRF